MILPAMTGVSRYLTGLCRGLGQLDGDFSYELWLQPCLAADHPARRLGGERLELRIAAAGNMSLAGHLWMPLAVARRGAHLLHYPHFDLPPAMPGPLVATIHDLKYIARPDFFPQRGRVKRLAIRWLTANTCRRARRILCDSQSTAGDLQRLLGVPAEKLRVVPLGVEEHFFEQKSEAARQAFRARRGLERPYLLFVGERRPHKNLPGLLRTFKEFRALGGAEYELVIAGKAYAQERSAEQTAQELGLAGAVRFVNEVPEDELPYYYQCAAALVFLSFYEGFGLPVLEAMASGTPVVASNCTALPEVVGEAGWLVAADDPRQSATALAEATAPGEARRSAIEQGLERARAFSWRRCAELTQQVYAEALEE